MSRLFRYPWRVDTSLQNRLFSDPRAPILLFAHRGYSALAPENTLAAFQKAVDRGIPGAEFDVQLSRDGEPVVIHDSTLKRTAGLDARVQDTPLAQIRALDAGGWFAPEFRGEKVPLLEEVFAAFSGRLYFDVELKWDSKTPNGLEEKVVQAIRRHGLERRCLLSSFNPYCLLRARRLAPEMPMALIWNNSRKLPFLLRHGVAAPFMPGPVAKPEGICLRGWSSRLLRLLGRRLVVWTVDDPQEAWRLIGLGVRGLISNDPGRIREVLGEA
jgi:glycerophosphoryl diester phosphodiesterase